MPARSVLRRGTTFAVLFLLVSLIAFNPQPSNADNHTYYPETGHYLGGGFRDYWKANGGLQVFGYPMTEEYRAPNGRTTQWFERARFELSPSGVIELGLLGREATIDRVFPQVPPQKNDANHRYFPETGHVVMWGFKTIWETKGGLPLFGFPISEEIDEQLASDGKWHIVQYFERVRMEYWPEFAEGKRVLISDLGRRMAPRERTAPLPPGSPPGSVPPSPNPPPAPGLPPNVNASVTPPSGPVGTQFSFVGFGFQPGETIALWATAPDKSVIPASFEATADADGSTTSSGITFTAIDGIPTGIWALTAQGKSSGNAAVGYFEITGNTAPPPPPGSLPGSQNARVEPTEGPQGSRFSYFAGGFEPGEEVATGLFNSAGDLISNVLVVYADGNGSIDYAQLYFQSDERTPPDVYQIYSEGGTSAREAFAYLRVTAASPASLAIQATGTVQRAAPNFGFIGRADQ
jgi:hypothetical protein